jgi:hypothetical protein
MLKTAARNQVHFLYCLSSCCRCCCFLGLHVLCCKTIPFIAPKQLYPWRAPLEHDQLAVCMSCLHARSAVSACAR